MATKKTPAKTAKKPAKKKAAPKKAVKKTASKTKTVKKTEEMPPKKTNGRLFWVGIGASAGGLEALRAMVEQLPKRATNFTYIIAQHLSPKHQSMMVQLLSRETTLRVEELEAGTKPEAGVIYITPPNSDVFVRDGALNLREPPSEYSPKPSVDFFFTTLAEELEDHAIGVILSGTGSDGSHGTRAIRAAGGLTIAQTPETAKYDGMPGNAIDTGCVDLVLPPEEIGSEMLKAVRSPHSLKFLHEEEISQRTGIQELMHMLKQRTGVDFKDYKTGTLFRRLNRRMAACNVLDLDEYIEHVQGNPSELDMLFKDIMIAVTSFFRDKDAFADLRESIRGLLAEKEEDDPIRVWVPGCTTGEEAYSIVILFAEEAGGLSRLQQQYNFQLFATDIDIDALGLARKGLYPETTLEGVDKKIRERYFRHKDNNYEIVKTVRDMVVFSKHNVFNDPPFLRLDLISCRNLLIYFNNKLQNTVLNLFHYALNPSGLMFLGKSETIGHSANLFQSINSRAKIFKRKIVTTGENTRMARVSYATVGRVETPAISTIPKISHDLPDAVIAALSPDSLLIDEDMNVVRIYGDVQAYTQLSAGDASTNVVSLVRKEFRQELRAMIYKVLREDMPQSILPKKLSLNGKMHRVNIVIRPLNLKNSPERLLLVSFEKIKKVKEEEIPAKKGKGANDPLIAELEQELALTKEHLQTVVEELETSNEELQSTNEEMQSTNEELQSSNEELETSNEELQSTNEELITVNEELQIKSSELSATNEDLENIKESIDFALIVVDEELKIKQFNKAAFRLFMLRDGSAGEALTSVATTIDIPDIRKNVVAVIKKGKPFTRQLEEEGKYYYERILPYKDENGQVNGAVLTYIDNTPEQLALEQLKRSEERYDLAVQGSNAGIWDWDIKSGAMHWSPLFIEMLEIKKKSFKPSMKAWEERMHPDDRDDVMDILRAHLERGFDFNVEFRMQKEDGSYIWLHVRGQAIWNDNREAVRMAGSLYDITDRREAIEQLTRSNEALERFAYVCSHDLKEPARVVSNYADLFVKQYSDILDQDGQAYLTHLQDGSARMQEMIKSILTYSQLENKNITLTKIDCESEVKKVIKNLKLSIDETGAEITYENLPAVRADRMQLFQIFQNLIGNAIKFCKNKKPRIHIYAEDGGDDWIIAVRDNGIGMKQEHAAQIFGVFKRLNKQEDFPGTGIGLSICQKIVSRHGGRIWVKSTPGKGSTFYFTLPKKQDRRKRQNVYDYDENRQRKAG